MRLLLALACLGFAAGKNTGSDPTLDKLRTVLDGLVWEVAEGEADRWVERWWEDESVLATSTAADSCRTTRHLHGCCAHVLVPNRVNLCCGYIPINERIHQERCCPTRSGLLLPLLDTMFCCNGLPYPKATMKCCGTEKGNRALPKARPCHSLHHPKLILTSSQRAAMIVPDYESEAGEVEVKRSQGSPHPLTHLPVAHLHYSVPTLIPLPQDEEGAEVTFVVPESKQKMGEKPWGVRPQSPNYRPPVSHFEKCIYVPNLF